MALPRTVSAANEVRAITNTTLLSTTSPTARCQPICLPGWNQLVSPAPMANAPMESRWYPRGVVGSLCGMPLVWIHLPPIYHLPSATRDPGAVAALVDQSEQEKYAALNPYYTFIPVTIETAGRFGPETFTFLRELGCYLRQVTGEAKSFSYLQQHLSVAV